MLNINELEKRWFVYKIKSYTPYLIITILILLTSSLLLFLFYNDNSLKNKVSIEKKEVKKFETHETYVKIADKVPTTAHVDVPKVKNDIQKVVLQPSLNFIDNVVINKPETSKKKIIKEKIIEVKPEPIIEKIIEVKINPEPIIEKIPVEENVSLQINKQNTSNDINLVIKRFKTNNNPALSLFIAKKYYEIGNFNQAYNYALITNQLNKDIEESWIIFSKSLVKLNKKDKAVEVLKQYVEYSSSSRAEILLSNIISGKFK